jgi:hypothetical protein
MYEQVPVPTSLGLAWHGMGGIVAGLVYRSSYVSASSSRLMIGLIVSCFIPSDLFIIDTTIS